MKRKIFEYDIDSINNNEPTLLVYLNDKGKEGWELISLNVGDDVSYMIFKREIIEKWVKNG